MGGNVREAAAGEVDVGAIVFLGLGADVVVEVCFYCLGLVPRALEEIGEATRAAVPRYFWGKVDETTNAGEVWASSLAEMHVSGKFNESFKISDWYLQGRLG